MELVTKNNDRITTSSMVVAEIFGKRHDNVLQSIEKVQCSKEFWLLNFQESNYVLRGKKYPLYFITKDGFMMLAMGFTGETAAKFKEAFIAAFNKMEKALIAAKSPVLLPTYQQRMLDEPTQSCPANMWCIFDQAEKMMFLIEKYVGSISEYDLVDGSIGQHWAKYREGKPWAKPFAYYWHEFKNKRGNQQSKCYEYSELQYFKVWLRSIYQSTHLHVYLHNKFKKEPTMLAKVEAFKPRLLSGR